MIYTYQNVQNFMESSDVKLKNKFQNILAYISDEKNELREPYVRHISQNRIKGLFEIRLKTSGTMARVVFSKQDENIILLYAFYKNDKKDTKRALEHSIRLLNDTRKNNYDDIHAWNEVYVDGKWHNADISYYDVARIDEYLFPKNYPRADINKQNTNFTKELLVPGSTKSTD